VPDLSQARRLSSYILVAIVLVLMVSTGIHVGAAPSESPQSIASLTEWAVPTARSGPWALTLDQNGNCCWFAEYYGNKIGHLDPTNGTFQEWTIPTRSSNPYGLAVTSISNSLVIWGTEFSADKVFAFWPNTGLFQEYRNPHYNTGVGYISVEPGTGARVWFTETVRNVNGELVYDPATGNATLYEDPFPPAAGGGAYGVYATAGAVWFAGLSGIVRWDRASQQYTIWPLPNHGSTVGRSVTLDSLGQLWYTQGSSVENGTDNFVGVLRGNIIQEWHLSATGADPQGISINPLTQKPWFAERAPRAVNGTIGSLENSTGGTIIPTVPTTAHAGFTSITLGPTSTEVAPTNSTTTPTTNELTQSSDGQFSGFTVGPQPRDVLVDSAGNAWFSEPVTNKIGRISPSNRDFALVASPQVVSLGQGTSASITVTGTSLSGFGGPVTLSYTNPPGVTLAFNPNPISVNPEGNTSSNVEVSVAPNAAGGMSSVTIQGSNGGVVHSIGVILIVSNSSTTAAGTGPKTACFIATATYGSELSPEVQLLRNFRDNSLAKTKSGSSFLIVFNTWYYSFSPSVASYIAAHEGLRTGMKVILYPLVAFLYVAAALYSRLSPVPELATIMSGLVASSLIGAFYVGIPWGLLARRFRKRSQHFEKCAVILLGGLCALSIGLIMQSTLMLMVASSATVLLAMAASAMLAARILSSYPGRHYSKRLMQNVNAISKP